MFHLHTVCCVLYSMVGGRDVFGLRYVTISFDGIMSLMSGDDNKT